MMFIERLSFGAADGGKQPYGFEISVLGAQKKAIAALVSKEALKDHVGVPQLANVVGPLYLRNKRLEISAGPQINVWSRLTTGAWRPCKI